MPLNNFNYLVTWTDFASQPSRPDGAHEDAHIQVHFNYTYQTGRNGNGVTINSAEVNIIVVLSRSWVVSGQMTNDLLGHEQGHYDITAIGARELYNALLQLTAPSGHALQTRAAQLNGRIQQKINRANTRYDTQTNHSQNTAAQHTWQQRIAAEKQKPDGSIDNLPQ